VHKALDGCFVEFQDVQVNSIEYIEPPDLGDGVTRVNRFEVLFSDSSAGESSAWLYQEKAQRITRGTRLAVLRGFVHAEGSGRYVTVSDKNEDITIG
jgi:hypothetical protein